LAHFTTGHGYVVVVVVVQPLLSFAQHHSVFAAVHTSRVLQSYEVVVVVVVVVGGVPHMATHAASLGKPVVR
jgi:hypothetical protein